MRTIAHLAVVAAFAVTACGDDETDTSAATGGPERLVTVTDEMTCKQLGGGWTFVYSRAGAGLVPPGDGAPTFGQGLAVTGTEANLPEDVMEASRTEREANGWGEDEVRYLTAVIDEDPLRGARFVARFGGGPADATDADHVAAIERVGRMLDDAPACS